MASRRAFLGLASGASLLATFRNDGLDRVLATGRGDGRINFNNGGVSPSASSGGRPACGCSANAG